MEYTSRLCFASLQLIHILQIWLKAPHPTEYKAHINAIEQNIIFSYANNVQSMTMVGWLVDSRKVFAAEGVAKG